MLDGSTHSRILQCSPALVQLITAVTGGSSKVNDLHALAILAGDGSDGGFAEWGDTWTLESSGILQDSGDLPE